MTLFCSEGKLQISVAGCKSQPGARADRINWFLHVSFYVQGLDVILVDRNFKIADEEHQLCGDLIDMNVVFPDFACAQRLIQTSPLARTRQRY